MFLCLKPQAISTVDLDQKYSIFIWPAAAVVVIVVVVVVVVVAVVAAAAVVVIVVVDLPMNIC